MQSFDCNLWQPFVLSAHKDWEGIVLFPKLIMYWKKDSILSDYFNFIKWGNWTTGECQLFILFISSNEKLSSTPIKCMHKICMNYTVINYIIDRTPKDFTRSWIQCYQMLKNCNVWVKSKQANSQVVSPIWVHFEMKLCVWCFGGCR